MIFWGWLGDNAALVVAICALFLTVYQAHLSRRHNRISVSPSLTSFASRKSDEGHGELRLELRNNGLGPALIDSFRFVLDDVDLTFDDSNEAIGFLTELVGNIQIKCEITTLTHDNILRSGDSVTVIHIVFLEVGRSWEHIESLVDRLALNVKYHSMYGEQFVYSTITYLDHQ